MNVMTVGKLTVVTHTSLNIRESIQGKLLMIVMSMGNLLVGVHSLLNIGFTLERDPMIVVNAGRPLVRTPTLFSIRKLTVESNPLNVKNVGKLSSIVHILLVIWEFIQGGNCEMKVVTPLVGVQIPLNIREPALGRNPLGVVMKVHAVDRSHRCVQCLKTFRLSSCLIQNQQVHFGGKMDMEKAYLCIREGHKRGTMQYCKAED